MTPAGDGPLPRDALPAPVGPEGSVGVRAGSPPGSEGDCPPPLPLPGSRESPPSPGTPTSWQGGPLAGPAEALEGGRKGQRPQPGGGGRRLPGSRRRPGSHALWCQSWRSCPAPPLPRGHQGTRHVAVDSVPWGHGFLSQWARAEDGFPPFDPCQLQGAGRAGPCQPGHRGSRRGVGGPRRVPRDFPDSPLPSWVGSWPLTCGPGSVPHPQPVSAAALCPSPSLPRPRP